MSTHSAIATISKGEFDIIDVPTKSPGEGEILLKAEYSAMIPFDTYQMDLGYAVQQYPTILGFNASGVVVDVGSGVKDLVAGDRVTAFSFGSKGMQEYSVQPRTVCAKIPHTLPLDEAATIPDNFVTAFYTLFNQLSLPIPDSFPATTPPPLASTPILIYGAGSTAGQYAIQLLHHAGYRNIIVTASSKHHTFLRSLGATSTFDYKSPDLISDIAKVVGGESNVTLAVDCIATESTLAIIAKFISPEGKLAVLLPVKEGNALTVGNEGKMFMEVPANINHLPKSTKIVEVRTFLYQKDHYLAENLMPKILPSLLESGLIRPSRVRLLDEGSFKERVSIGLDLLRNNKISGEKVVVKVTT